MKLTSTMQEDPIPIPIANPAAFTANTVATPLCHNNVDYVFVVIIELSIGLVCLMYIVADYHLFFP
jgi:hypothetical protein